MKVILVCGARPNFMKIAPLMRAINRHNVSSGSLSIQPVLVHTGQHYDYEMSRVFFEELELPKPDFHLGVGSGTHAEQTGRVMMEFEKVLFQENPDLVVVVGDVNSTLAAALATAKLHIPLAHVEAGERVYDRSLPEEINRLLTDMVSGYLLCATLEACENLRREGVPEKRIFFVGNIIVDSLLYHREVVAKRDVLSRLGLEREGYAVLTLHRQHNTDDQATFLRLLDAIREVARYIPVIFPVHPRTQKSIEHFGLRDSFSWLNMNGPVAISKNGLYGTRPLGYLDFLGLEMNCKFVMTDSGSVQGETTVLDVPCLTLSPHTDWTVTLAEGTNTLVGTEPERIIAEALKILAGQGKKGKRPPLWDGRTAERIVEILLRGKG